MQFTGTQLSIFRDIYTQNTNFGFAIDCYVDNITGRYDFGMSGDAGAFGITLQSGRILVGNQFVHSYLPYERFYLECQLTTSSFNLLKNNSPLVFGQSKTSGNFNYLYFSRASSDLFADFNFYASGQNVPNVLVDNVGYLLTNEQEDVTGLVHNQGSYPIRVFDSTAQLVQNLTYTKPTGNIAGGSGGAFIFNGDFDSFDFTQPILLNFDYNFGTFNAVFSIVDARSFNYFVFLQNISDFTANSSGQINRTLFYSNYSGGFLSNFPTDLTFHLEYSGGTGEFQATTLITGASYSTTLYASLFESGYLTGIAYIPTGDTTHEGTYIITLSQFAYATGLITGLFSGTATGMASGSDYTGLAVGDITGYLTGIILNGSGSFLFNSAFTGLPTISYSLNYPYYQTATGYLTVSSLSYNDFFYVGVENIPIIKGLQFFNETGLVYYLSGAPEHKVNSYFSGGIVYLSALANGADGNGVFVRPDSCNVGSMQYSPVLRGGFASGSTGVAVIPISTFTGWVFQKVTGSGDYSLMVTGYGNGTFYFAKTFTGQWDLLTGVDSNSLVSLKRPGNYDQLNISGEGIFPANSNVNFQVVGYLDDFSTDIAILTISGANVLNPIITTLYS